MTIWQRIVSTIVPDEEVHSRIDDVEQTLHDLELEKAREAAKRNGLVLPNGDVGGGR